MPLSKVAGSIPALPQQLWERPFLKIERVVHTKHARTIWRPACQNRRSCGTANRRSSVELFKDESILCHLGNVSPSELAFASAPGYLTPALIIRQQNYHVWPALFSTELVIANLTVVRVRKPVLGDIEPVAHA